MWFDSWSDIGRTNLVGAVAYAALILVIRVAGKRTLSQFNAYDYVVTVAFGSIVATILLNADVSFAEGVAALVLLAGLQFLLALATRRMRWLRRLASARPSTVIRDGEFIDAELRRNRLTEDDVRQAVRSSGHGWVSDVAAAVLETDGSISIVTRDRLGDASALS